MSRVFRGCLRSVLVTVCGLAIVLTAAVLLMMGILAVNKGLPQTDEAYISSIIGAELPAYREKASEDTHGGFHGDGSAWFVYAFDEIQAQMLEERICAAPGWRSLPMTKTVERFLFGGVEEGVPYAAHAGASGFSLPQTGYWFILDEQAEDEQRHSDAYFLDRHSINVKFAVYDADRGKMLFYELDT